MRYRARHLLILALLLGMATSNLSSVLWPGAGTVFRALGLRQFWSMFAPNTVHDARFVDAVWVDQGGAAHPLDISREPPSEGFFWEWGYDRIHKFHKQVAKHPERYAAPYAAALCRVHGLEGSITLSTVHRVSPKPADALAGARPTRTETPLGSWACR